MGEKCLLKEVAGTFDGLELMTDWEGVKRAIHCATPPLKFLSDCFSA